jgi:NAD+--asparagine ADP-ribosyltransferase
MQDIEIKFKLTLRLSEKRAGTMSTDELINYIKDKLNESLGSRGKVSKLSVVNE